MTYPRKPTRSISKDILQCELHDSRIFGTDDLTKCIAIQGAGWIVSSKAVGDIECLAADLNLLAFPEPESPGQGQIKLPVRRTEDIAGPHVSDRPQGRLLKRFDIQVGERIPIGKRISQHLVRPLRADFSIQRAIQAAADRHIVSCGELINSRQPPSRGQHTQRRIGKLWSLGRRGYVENLPAV